MDTIKERDPDLWSRVLDEGSDGSVPAEFDGTEWTFLAGASSVLSAYGLPPVHIGRKRSTDKGDETCEL